MDINVEFCRRLLSLTHADVRAAFPTIPNVLTAAGVTRHRRGYFIVEIHVAEIPGLVWEGRADNAFEARHEAWTAFLEKHGKDKAA
jgi:hypothetical protein